MGHTSKANIPEISVKSKLPPCHGGIKDNKESCISVAWFISRCIYAGVSTWNCFSGGKVALICLWLKALTFTVQHSVPKFRKWSLSKEFSFQVGMRIVNVIGIVLLANNIVLSCTSFCCGCFMIDIT